MRHFFVARLVAGKSLGFAIGLVIALFLPLFLADAGWLLRMGIVFWYTTLGLFVGLLGATLPQLQISLPWWTYSTATCAWMNFMLSMFAHEPLANTLGPLLGTTTLVAVIGWFTLEGAAIGLLIGFCIQRIVTLQELSRRSHPQPGAVTATKSSL